MSINILLAVAIGIGAGFFFFPPAIIEYTDYVLDIGLCLLLFFVGIDIGKNKEVLGKIKSMGFKILLVPLMIAIGSIGGSMVAGFLLKIPFNESGAVGAGFGWYTLSSMLLTNYSTELSALAFITNVVREVLALISIPIIAKYVGDMESIAPAGATAMDTALPVISKSTNSHTVIISFITGVILSTAVPILVPLLIRL